MTGFVIEAFSPMAKNTVLGFATVKMPSGLVFHDVGIHQKNGSAWASPASKPMLDRNGTKMQDSDGKGRWVPVISFADKRTRDRWSGAVIQALREQHPEALS